MTALARDSWRERTLAALLIVSWLAATAWARPLSLPDEGRYVGVAWEMLRSGEWLTPTLNGLPFFHKPPLFYWITAAWLWLFGLHEWAARAASILGASIGAFALYAFTQRWIGQRTARAMLLALLAQPLWMIGGQFANHDMLVAGCISATIVLLAHAVLCIEHRLPHRRALAGAYVMAALGVLAKGLIGVVLPALVVLVWLLLTHSTRALWAPLRAIFRALTWAPAVALFVAIAAPWFVAMQWQHADFMHYFFVVQHFDRYAGGGFNNVQPVWFFPVVLVLFTLPWWPWAAGLFNRPAPAIAHHGAVRRLMWVWLGVVLVFFSLPQSKLLGYVLPAVPPLAYLIADAFVSIAAPARRTRLWWASAAVASLLSLGAVVGFSLYPLKSTRALAATLILRHDSQEPVFMLGHFYYDLPFYAGLTDRVSVVDDWHSPKLALRDDWRKELADAGRFALPATAAAALLTPASFAQALCSAKTAWVVAAPQAAHRHPVLAHAQRVASAEAAALWRVDTRLPGAASALGCAGTPNAG